MTPAQVELLTRDYWATLAQEIKNSSREILAAYFLLGDRWPRNSAQPGPPAHAFCDAAKRGVTVALLLANPKPRAPSRAQAFKAMPTLHASGVRVAYVPDAKVLHAKFCVIDRCTVILGSHNLTATSLQRNQELGVIIRSAPFAERARVIWRQYARGALSAAELCR